MKIQIDFDNKEIVLLDDTNYQQLVNFLARIPNAAEYTIRAADSNTVYIPYYPYPTTVTPWWEYIPTVTYCQGNSTSLSHT